MFVEFERDKNLHKNIMEIIKTVTNATEITEWNYEYYKGDGSKELTEDNLSETVLDNQQEYVLKYNQPKNEDLDRIKTLAGV